MTLSATSYTTTARKLPQVKSKMIRFSLRGGARIKMMIISQRKRGKKRTLAMTTLLLVLIFVQLLLPLLNLSSGRNALTNGFPQWTLGYRKVPLMPALT